MTPAFSPLPFLKTGTGRRAVGKSRVGGWYLKFTCVEALSAASDGRAHSFAFLPLLRSRLCCEAWRSEDHSKCAAIFLSLSVSLSLTHTHLHAVSLSLSLCLSLSLSPCICLALPLSTVRCVNTSHASSKAFRLAGVHANYVEYYLEDAVLRTVTV